MKAFARTLLLACAAVVASPALAAGGDALQAPEPDRAAELDRLFGELAAAQTAEEAIAVQHGIERLWNRSDSATVDLFMAWALQAVSETNYGAALDFLDQAALLAPDYPEVFNRRATVYFLMHEYAASIADVERTLALEPRHFNALSGLGMILEDLDRTAEAYEAYRRALAVYPTFQGPAERVEALRTEVEGRPI